MSVNGGLYAGVIDCLVSSLLNGVRWLGVFARDKLFELSREIRPLSFILNTDPNDQPGTQWLPLYAPIVDNIKVFDSFGLSPRIYC